MDEQVTSTVIEMLKQMQTNMNSRFDRFEERNENIRKQVADLDRDAVRRTEFQDTFKGMLEEFSKMTERLETEVRALAAMKPVVDSIVPRSEHEAQWRLQTQIHSELRREITEVRAMIDNDDRELEQRQREKRQLVYSIIAGVVSSGIMVLGTYLFSHFKW